MSNNVKVTGDLTIAGAATGVSLDVSGALQGATVTADATTNQLVLGTTNTTTISSTAPSASRTITLHDAGAASNFVLDTGGAMTISNAATSGYVLTGTSSTASSWQVPPLQYIRRTLTASEIRGLFATPIELLPAPGANLSYAVAYVSIFYSYSTAVFAGGGPMYLRFFTNGANLLVSESICTTTILTAGVNDRRMIYPTGGYTTFQPTNQSVRIENDTAAFTGASAAGTLQINVWYTLVNHG